MELSKAILLLRADAKKHRAMGQLYAAQDDTGNKRLALDEYEVVEALESAADLLTNNLLMSR